MYSRSVSSPLESTAPDSLEVPSLDDEDSSVCVLDSSVCEDVVEDELEVAIESVVSVEGSVLHAKSATDAEASRSVFRMSVGLFLERSFLK